MKNIFLNHEMLERCDSESLVFCLNEKELTDLEKKLQRCEF